jgi:predicted RNA-binding protein YlxR (DUF448 family)
MRLVVSHENSGRSRHAMIDRAGTLPGRGAYLCRAGSSGSPTLPNADCLQLAERRRSIARALRCAVTLPPEFVELVGQ